LEGCETNCSVAYIFYKLLRISCSIPHVCEVSLCSYSRLCNPHPLVLLLINNVQSIFS